MKKTMFVAISLAALFVGCGGGGSSSSGASTSTQSSSSLIGVFVDAPVSGIEYTAKPSGYSGVTNAAGEFKYSSGDVVTFNLGAVTLGSAAGSQKVTPLNLANTTDVNDAKVVTMLRALQSLDQDGDLTNGIQISAAKRDELKKVSTVNLSASTFSSDSDFEAKTNIKLRVSSEEAKKNFVDYNNKTSTTTTTTPTQTPASGAYSLIAWNDLGMHCVDGNDYSVFSILPPFNNLKAQLINRSGTKLVSSGVSITYESTADESGSVNSSSAGKTNFWDYAGKMYGWLFKTTNRLLANMGLATENPAPSSTPAAMKYSSASGLWEADGIPITPYDDKNIKNYYPMVKVVAKDSAGNLLASTKTVLPVSDEMDCAACHASTVASSAAKPSGGWVNDKTSVQKDWKKNILRLHDEKFPTAVSANSASLAAKGYSYKSKLEDTANAGTPVLCASCHSSNALGGSGVSGVKPLTQALHAKHASVKDPKTSQTLGSSTNRDSCYSCHPGSVTKCLRGAMGDAKTASGANAIDCQSCHGGMAHVGSTSREGWLDEPNCQQCHDKDSKGSFVRYTSVFSSGTTLRATVDTKFATTANTPAQGKSLYRLSKGHGGVSCEACHGSTHAEYPSSHANDNAQSIALQGHSGAVAECTVCHATTPTNFTGGPHGMHVTGQSAVSQHQKIAENSGSKSCTVCHGADYRGTILSATSQARTLTVEGKQKTFAAKQKVGCYDCHNGPNP